MRSRPSASRRTLPGASTRRWAARYYNLQRWTLMPRGGHFAPMEEPDLLLGEIREFFRPLRNE